MGFFKKSSRFLLKKNDLGSPDLMGLASPAMHCGALLMKAIEFGPLETDACIHFCAQFSIREINHKINGHQ